MALALALVPASLAAAQSATPTPLPGVALQAGAHPVGQPSGASIGPAGGQVALGDGALTIQASADPSRPALTFVYQAVDARSLPAAQSGLSLGFAAFQLSAVNDAEPALVANFNVPIDLVIKPSASDLALGLGNVGRLHLGSWNGSSWVAVPCSTDINTGNLLVCSTTRAGLFVPLIVLPGNPVLDQLDFPTDDGHFYTQGNGFGGGGGLGYSVLDDGDAPIWTEFQHQGGVHASAIRSPIASCTKAR